MPVEPQAVTALWDSFVLAFSGGFGAQEDTHSVTAVLL